MGTGRRSTRGLRRRAVGIEPAPRLGPAALGPRSNPKCNYLYNFRAIDPKVLRILFATVDAASARGREIAAASQVSLRDETALGPDVLIATFRR